MMLDLPLILRIVQAVTGLAVLALSSYVAQWYDRETLTPSPSQFHYLLNSALFSCASVVYLYFVPVQWPRFAHPYASFVLEALNFGLLFGGFIALVIFLLGLKFCRGDVCGAARATATISSLGCLAWLLTSVLSGRHVLRAWLPGARRGRYAPPPDMANV